MRIPALGRGAQDAVTRDTDAVYRAALRADDATGPLRASLTEYRDARITEAVTGQLDVGAVSDAHMDERMQPGRRSASVSDLEYLVFSLHALDRMTQRGIAIADVQRVLDQDGPTSYDLDGNHRYDLDIDGRSIRVVASADKPLFVITVYAPAAES